MGVFTESFTNIADSVLYDKHFVTYSNGHYILHFINNSFSGNVETNSAGQQIIACSFGSSFIYFGGQWYDALRNEVSGFYNNHVSGDAKLVYSSYDIYDDNGDLFYSGCGTYAYVVAGNVSSSMIVDTLKKSILPVVPLVCVAVLVYIAFRKAWDFLRGAVKGA